MQTHKTNKTVLRINACSANGKKEGHVLCLFSVLFLLKVAYKPLGTFCSEQCAKHALRRSQTPVCTFPCLSADDREFQKLNPMTKSWKYLYCDKHSRQRHSHMAAESLNMIAVTPGYLMHVRADTVTVKPCWCFFYLLLDNSSVNSPSTAETSLFTLCVCRNYLECI